MTGTLQARYARRSATATMAIVGSVMVGLATLAFGGDGWRAAFNAVWTLPVIAAGVEDAFTGRLRDVIVLRGLGFALAAGTLVAIIEHSPRILVMITVGGLLMGAWMLIVHLVSPRGLGFGDVKFGLLLGCGIGLLTPVGVMVVVAVAVLFQVTVAIGQWLPAQRSGVAARGEAPFGPSLALASILFVVVLTAVRGGAS